MAHWPLGLALEAGRGGQQLTSETGGGDGDKELE
jgi:hypothetical protein